MHLGCHNERTARVLCALRPSARHCKTSHGERRTAQSPRVPGTASAPRCDSSRLDLLLAPKAGPAERDLGPRCENQDAPQRRSFYARVTPPPGDMATSGTSLVEAGDAVDTLRPSDGPPRRTAQHHAEGGPTKRRAKAKARHCSRARRQARGWEGGRGIMGWTSHRHTCMHKHTHRHTCTHAGTR